MSPLPLVHRHFRWFSQIVFWSAVALAALLLLLPAAGNGPAVWFVPAAGLLGGTWFFLGAAAKPRETTALGPAVLALAAAWTAATLASADPADALNAATQLGAGLLLFWIARTSARDARSVGQGLAWLVLLAAALAAYGLYQYWVGLPETYQRVFSGRPPAGPMEHEIARRLLSQRAFSLFTYPNLLAGFLAMLLPVGLALAWDASRPRRLLWSAAAAVMVLGLLATRSLGGWLAAAAGVGIFAWLLPAGRARRWGLAAFGAAAVLGLGVLFHARGPGEAAGGMLGRFQYWAGAWRMGLEHPLFGVGPGLFGVYYSRYQTGADFTRFAHSLPLQLWAETGLAGIAAFAWLAVVAVRRIGAAWRENPDGQRRRLMAGLTAGIAAFGLHACLDVDFFFLKNAAVFWLCLGALLGLAIPRGVASESDARRGEAAETGLSAWLQGGLFVLLVFVLWHGGRSLWVEGALYAGAAGLGALWLIARRSSAANGGWLGDLPLARPLGWLYGWSVFSALVSPHPAAAVPGLLLAAAGLTVYVIAAHQPGLDRRLLRLLPACALVLAVVALTQAAAQPGERAAAGWPNPNLLAAFMAAGTIAALAGATARSARTAERIAAGAAAAVLFAALLATGSLGGILNVCAGTACLAFWRGRRDPARGWLPPALLAAALSVALLLPTLTGRRLTHLEEYRAQAYERVHMAVAALGLASDRPLTGYGPGNFEDGFERHSFPNVRGVARYGMRTAFAHNEALQILAVAGVPGLLLLLWLLAEAARLARRQWRAPDGKADRHRIAAWSVLAGAAAQGMVDFNWHAPALLIWSLCLLGAALGPEVSGESRPGIRDWREQWWIWSRRPSAVMILLLALLAVSGAVRPLLAQYRFEHGEALRYKKDFQAAADEFRKTIRIHPWQAGAYDRLGQTYADFFAASGDAIWRRQAEALLLHAGRLDRMDAYVHRHLGQLYALHAAHLAGRSRQEQMHRAIREYRAAAAMAPHQAFLRFELGNLERAAGYLSQAEQSWSRAVNLEPAYAAAWSNLGLAQEMRGAWSEAENSYRRALAVRHLQTDGQNKYEIELISLNWAIVHFNLAHLLERQDRWREAGEEYGRVLELEPENDLARHRWSLLKQTTP